jgi:hypothetical protein
VADSGGRIVLFDFLDKRVALYEPLEYAKRVKWIEVSASKFNASPLSDHLACQGWGIAIPLAEPFHSGNRSNAEFGCFTNRPTFGLLLYFCFYFLGFVCGFIAKRPRIFVLVGISFGYHFSFVWDQVSSTNKGFSESIINPEAATCYAWIFHSPWF